MLESKTLKQIEPNGSTKTNYMAYNKFRWWTNGRPNKPLKADAPLLLKIRNGDFDYSYMFSEARLDKEYAQKAS